MRRTNSTVLEYKNIEGFRYYYAVNSVGDVISIRSGKNLTPKRHTGGYLQVCLSVNQVKSYRYIHRLVAEAFIDNPDNLPIVNHKDTDKRNNNYLNLEWCTQQHNIDHSIDNNLNVRGESSHFSKLDGNRVRLIRKSFPTKSLGELAIEFNVTKATISRIVNNKIWKGVINEDI